MPSPPLAPGQSAIDLVHLRRMTMGDVSLEHEVLQMFKAQSADILDRLVKVPSNASELSHTLKGSARAVGAFQVGDAAQHLESALRTSSNISTALKVVQGAVEDAIGAIESLIGKDR